MFWVLDLDLEIKKLSLFWPTLRRLKKNVGSSFEQIFARV